MRCSSRRRGTTSRYEEEIRSLAWEANDLWIGHAKEQRAIDEELDLMWARGYNRQQLDMLTERSDELFDRWLEKELEYDERIKSLQSQLRTCDECSAALERFR